MFYQEACNPLLLDLTKRLRRCRIDRIGYDNFSQSHCFEIWPQGQRRYLFKISDIELWSYTEPGRVIETVVRHLNLKVLERRRELVAATNGKGYW